MEKNIDKRLKEYRIKKIKQFGLSFTMGMAILFVISIWKDFILPLKLIIAFMFFYHLLSTFLYYKLLYPTYILISFIGNILGNLLTVIIFTVVFYFLFTPIAMILRLLKKDIVKNISASPQWIPILDKQNNPQRVEHLF